MNIELIIKLHSIKTKSEINVSKFAQQPIQQYIHQTENQHNILYNSDLNEYYIINKLIN